MVGSSAEAAWFVNMAGSAQCRFAAWMTENAFYYAWQHSAYRQGTGTRHAFSHSAGTCRRQLL